MGALGLPLTRAPDRRWPRRPGIGDQFTRPEPNTADWDTLRREFPSVTGKSRCTRGFASARTQPLFPTQKSKFCRYLQSCDFQDIRQLDRFAADRRRSEAAAGTLGIAAKAGRDQVGFVGVVGRRMWVKARSPPPACQSCSPARSTWSSFGNHIILACSAE